MMKLWFSCRRRCCRAAVTTVLAAVACGPSRSSGGGGDDAPADPATTSGPGPAQTSGGSAQTTDVQPTTAGGMGSAGDSGGSSTGEFIDPCVDFPADACPEECTVISAYRQLGNEGCDIDPDEVLQFCVYAEQELPQDVRTTFYAPLEGQWRYHILGQSCISGPNIRPAGWTECTGAPEDPELCACLCDADGCKTDQDLDTLQMCDWDMPCGPADTHYKLDPLSPYYECMFTSLRDRVPGAYQSIAYTWPTSYFAHVFVGPDEQAQLISNGSGDACFGPEYGTGGEAGAQRCMLRPVEFFDNCLAQRPSLQLDFCFAPSQWLWGCEPTDPVCE